MTNEHLTKVLRRKRAELMTRQIEMLSQGLKIPPLLGEYTDGYIHCLNDILDELEGKNGEGIQPSVLQDGSME